MAVIDTAALAAQFKRVYGNKITDLYGRHKMTYNQFFKSNRTPTFRPGGAGFYFSLRQGDIESTGGRAENAPLPEPLAGDGVQGVVTPRLIYQVIRMSGLAIEAGKGSIAAFVDAQGDATMNAFNALVTDLNRQCWGDGYGLLGTTSADATPSTSTTWDVVFDNDTGVRYIRKGMICDFYNGAAIDQSASSVRVSSVNPNTKTVTFEVMADAYRAYHPLAAAQSYSNGTGTIASGSFLVRYGARLATHSTSNPFYEIMGLLGMYDDSTRLATFEGITIADDPEFKANIVNNGGTGWDLTVDRMLACMDMTAARSTTTVRTIRMGLGQRRKYFALLAPDVRYQPQKLKGGYEQLAFSQDASVEIIVDPVTPPNKLFFEPERAIQKYELTGIGWGGFDPNKMHWRDGYDQATMYLRTYTNLGVENRPGLTLLDDLNEPTTSPF